MQSLKDCNRCKSSSVPPVNRYRFGRVCRVRLRILKVPKVIVGVTTQLLLRNGEGGCRSHPVLPLVLCSVQDPCADCYNVKYLVPYLSVTLRGLRHQRPAEQAPFLAVAWAIVLSCNQPAAFIQEVMIKEADNMLLEAQTIVRLHADLMRSLHQRH